MWLRTSHHNNHLKSVTRANTKQNCSNFGTFGCYCRTLLYWEADWENLWFSGPLRCEHRCGNHTGTHPHVSKHSPPSYTSSWLTSTSTTTEPWCTQNTQRQSVSYFSLCASLWEKQQGKLLCWSITEGVCRPLSSTVTITNNKGGRWVEYPRQSDPQSLESITEPRFQHVWQGRGPKCLRYSSPHSISPCLCA